MIEFSSFFIFLCDLSQVPFYGKWTSLRSLNASTKATDAMVRMTVVITVMKLAVVQRMIRVKMMSSNVETKNVSSAYFHNRNLQVQL